MGKKKANGEGSISKRKDGRYMGRYTVGGKRKSVYGATHAEVRAILNEILNEIAKGEYIEPTKETVGSWTNMWLVTYALPSVKQSTYISYEGYIRIHIVPELGDIPLSSLSMEICQKFFNMLQKKKKLSPKTIRNIYNMFHYALDQATINRKIVRNPLLGIKLPKNEKKELIVFNRDEQSKLQTAAMNAPELQAFGVIFTLNTGLRLGELIGLKWEDVDFSKHSIRIRRTIGRLQKVDEEGKLMKKTDGVKTTELVIRTPKSTKSQRVIPLFDKLWEGLMEYRKQQNRMIDAFGEDYEDNGYIFCNAMGKIYDPRVYEDLYKRCLRDAGLRNIKFHALRHTFATRALEAGMDIEVLSKLLGHAQASTTLNLYGHALPDHKKDSMSKMSAYYMNQISIDTDIDTYQIEAVAV